MPLDFSQKNIKRKLRKYLQTYLPQSALIDKLSKGYCAGFTAIYMYAIWLESEPKDPKSPVPRDDLDWLLNALHRVIKWDERRALSSDERNEFERLINLLEYYQHALVNTDIAISSITFDKLFFDSKGRQAVREYTIAAHFTRTEVVEILKRIVRDNKLIFVHSHNHVVGLLKRGDEFFYIDSNISRSVLTVKYIELAATFIFEGNDFMLEKPSPLSFEIIGIDSHDFNYPAYPPQQELLKDLKIFQPGYEFIRFANEWKDESGYTALFQAVTLECIQSVDYLLNHLQRFPAGYINKVSDSGESPLMMACVQGDVQIAAALIKAGANIHIRDEKGGTALTYAILFCLCDPHSKIVDLLIAAGANMNEIYKNSLTPILLGLIQNIAPTVIRKLYEAGADPTVSLYMYAAHQLGEKNQADIIRSLQDLGADNQQALRLAIEKDDVKAVAFLMKFNVNINLPDRKDGMTPLGLAVKRRNPAVLIELLREESDLSIKMPDGKSALMLADDFISFEILMHLGSRPEQGWHDWVVSANQAGLDVNVYLTTLLHSYIQHKQHAEDTLSQYFHRMFGDSKEIIQAKELLRLMVRKDNREPVIDVDDLRDLHQIYKEQAAYDYKQANQNVSGI